MVAGGVGLAQTFLSSPGRCHDKGNATHFFSEAT